MSNSPILLIAWLDPDEKHKADDIFEALESGHLIKYASEGSGVEARDAVRRHIHNQRPDSSQIIMILTHGSTQDIGPKSDPGATWDDLWEWLKEPGLHNQELWLCACESASCVSRFSKMLAEDPGPPVGVIIGFEDKPSFEEVKDLTQALMDDIKSMRLITAERSLELARKTVPERRPVAYVHGVGDDGKTAFVAAGPEVDDLV